MKEENKEAHDKEREKERGVRRMRRMGREKK